MRRTIGTVFRSFFGLRARPALALADGPPASGLVMLPRQKASPPRLHEEGKPKAPPAPRVNGCDFFGSFRPDISTPEHGGNGEMASYRAGDLDGIVRNGGEAVAVFDAEMCYLQANQRWIEDLGLAERPFLGRSQFEVFPAAHDNWRRVFQEALEGKGGSHKNDPGGNGSDRTYHWEVRPWRRLDARIGGIVMKWGRGEAIAPKPSVQPPPLPVAPNLGSLNGHQGLLEEPESSPQEGLLLHAALQTFAAAHEGVPSTRALSVIPETSEDLYWQSRLHIVAMNAKGRVLRKSEGAAGLFTASAYGGDTFLWDAYGDAKDDPEVCKTVLAALKGILRNPTSHSLLSLPLKHTYVPWEAPLHWQLSITRGAEWGEQGFAIMAVGVSSSADGPLADVAAKEVWELPEPPPSKPIAGVSAGRGLVGRSLSGARLRIRVPGRRRPAPVPVEENEPSDGFLLPDAPVSLPLGALTPARNPTREAMLQYIPDVIPFGIAVVDVLGCCVYHNSVLAMLLGRRIYDGQRMEDFLTMGCRDERHRRQVSTAWREVVWARQAPHSFSLTSADGQLRKIELRPSLLPGGHILVSFRDFTEDCLNDAILESSEKTLRHALLQVPLPVILSDLAGVPQGVNDGVVELLGFEREEWPGLPLDSWLSLSSQAARRTAFRKSSAQPRQSFEVELYHRDGGEWRATMQVCRIADAQGDPLLFVHYIVGAEKLSQGDGMLNG